MPFARRPLALAALLLAPAALAQPRLDSLGLAATRAGEPRSFVYTNKLAASLYGQAAGPQTSAWQGFTVRGFPFVDDWAWTAQGTRRTARDLASATAYPDRVERRYAAGLAETVRLVDGLDAVMLDPAGRGVEAFEPLVADSRDAAYFEVRARGDVLLIARKNRLTPPPTPEGVPAPAWLAVVSEGARAEARSSVVETGGVDGLVFAPGRLRLRGDRPVVLAVAATPQAAEALARRVLRERQSLERARRARMQALLDASYVATRSDPRFDAALAWARLSLDALGMRQRGAGLYAGLPWFNTYWGRDTFVSLPGAFLATGAWDEARDVLLAFAARQDRRPGSDTYGRIPNTVGLDDVNYNTVDGTPWFVVQSAAYLRRQRDPASLATLYAAATAAAEGARRHADADGLLRHDDQATWMDASAGPGREWSPRGDRALDVQALYARQLDATAEMATLAGDAAASGRYRAEAARVRAAVQRRFRIARQTGAWAWADHLNPDGTPDRQSRPNVLFALDALGLSRADAARVTRDVAAELVYPHGVASLAQTDPAFHPYHESPEHYPKDAAYHNGTVWTWLAGPLVSGLVKQGATDRAYEQTAFLTRLALDRGAAGTLPENTDALPRPGAADVRLSGTVSQAWTLAEYVRNAFEDYAGVTYLRPDVVRIEPHLPAAWGEAARVRFRLGDGHVTATHRHGGAGDNEVLETTLDAGPGIPAGALAEVVGVGALKRVRLAPGRRTVVRLTREANGPYVVTNAFVGEGAAGAAVEPDGVGMDERVERPNAAWWEGFRWATPRSPQGLATLRGPGWPLLAHADVKAPTPPTATVRLDAADPSGDDRGPTGTYAYPSHPQFRPGILDATRLTIRETPDAWFFDLRFRDLAQPGWNPHYGFQLTEALLLFGTTGRPAPAPAGSGVTLPGGYRYAVVVGGGVRVEDATGRTLAEYRPAQADARLPLGSTTDRAIAFSIPKAVLPALPAGTPVTLLVGAQDDHGGAGLGDFRAVDAARSEWAGGGRPPSETSRAYDRVEAVLR